MKASAGAGGSAPVKLNGTSDAIIPVDNADAWVVGSDRMDRDNADATKDYRAFFNKIKGAFRAGDGGGSDWNDSVVGVASAAFGRDTRATATYTFACGQGSDAISTCAHAEGFATTASGSNSHSEGSVTTASGQNSHAEGLSSTASATNSHAEGNGSTASGSAAHAEGTTTTASGNSAHAEGSDTVASGVYAHAGGRSAVAPRSAQRSRSGGQFSAAGDAQACEMVLRHSTTDATPVALTVAAGAVVLTGTSTNVLTLLASRAFKVKVDVVARRTDVQGEMAGFTWEGLVGRDSTGSARIIGTPTEAAWGDTPATDAWALGVSIDTTDATNNYVKVSATGEAAKTIRWVANLDWVEVAG